MAKATQLTLSVFDYHLSSLILPLSLPQFTGFLWLFIRRRAHRIQESPPLLFPTNEIKRLLIRPIHTTIFLHELGFGKKSPVHRILAAKMGTRSVHRCSAWFSPMKNWTVNRRWLDGPYNLSIKGSPRHRGCEQRSHGGPRIHRDCSMRHLS